MAKPKTDTEALVARPTNELLAVAAGADRADLRGKEALDTADLLLPRIAVCQNNTPQKDEDNDAAYIPGLKEGDLFNTLSQQIYGRGPITIAVIRVDKGSREFEKGPDGKRTKNILDYNVPWDDARCEFTAGPNGERIPPVADRNFDYLVYLPESMEIAAVRMERTKMPVAKRFNSFLALRPGAAWMGLFRLSAVKEEKNGNKYMNYRVDLGGPSSPEIVKVCEEFATQFAAVKVKVHEGADEPEAGVVDTAKVPF